jgi:cytochrome P450
MQTSEAIWGKDALDFRPHRFLEPMTAEMRRAYMPVGYGPRACPAFASDISMIGVKAFLQILLPKYDVKVDYFVPVPGTMAEEMPEETLYSVKPVALV